MSGQELLEVETSIRHLDAGFCVYIPTSREELYELMNQFVSSFSSIGTCNFVLDF